MTTDVLIVMTNCPDHDIADRIAHALVEGGLAACVNRLPSVRSIYRWQGVLEEAEEVQLLIKTTAARYVEVEAAIRALHPYELPEIVGWPATAGLAGYLDWVTEETRRSVRA